MPQQPPYDERPVPQYGETVAPSNPPNAVVNEPVRRTAVWTYLGIIVAFFLIVGAAFLFWAGDGRELRPDDERLEPNAVGTSGDRTPGGFDPAPRHDDTADELEFRGGAGAALDSLDELESSRTLNGRRVELDNVEVERVNGTTFTVRDGNHRATVVTAAGPTVRSGQRVNVAGIVEQDGNTMRIRANRIEVR
jgi:uncharacterized protein YdeI (BOF family)